MSGSDGPVAGTAASASASASADEAVADASAASVASGATAATAQWRLSGRHTSAVGVDEYLAYALGLLKPLETIRLLLLDAHGCRLAEDLAAPRAYPPFDMAAVDGYAVVAQDTLGASPSAPQVLPVVGDAPAGAPPAWAVRSGFSVHVVAGAPMPPGADAVVADMDTDGGRAEVAIHRQVARGDGLRRVGSSVRRGDLVLAAGTELGAAQVALAAALGCERLPVRPRPRLVVLSTGDELEEPGQRERPGGVLDAGSFLLTLAARECGAVAYRVGIVPDDPRRLAAALDDQQLRADLIVTTGGVVDLLAAIEGGAQVRRLAVVPGGRVAVGTVGADRVPFFGLPGEPGAAYVAFEVLVRPAVRALAGTEPVIVPPRMAYAAAPLCGEPGVRAYIPVALHDDGTRLVADPLGPTGTDDLAVYARADGLAVVPEQQSDIPAGGAVVVHPLR